MKTFLTTFLILILPLSIFAEVHLISWQSENSAPRVILPRLESETPTQAVWRYQQNLKQTFKIFDSKIGITQDLSPEKNSGSIRLAFIANEFHDMAANGERIQRNLKVFTNAGAQTYVIALSADLGLSQADAQDYRDRSELSLVQNFKKSDRGIFFGICRGHQMGAIADGHTLHQDLTKTKSGTTNYHINLSGQNSTDRQTWHGIDIEKSLLSRFLNEASQLQVNSIHHQAVNINPMADSYSVATDDKDQLVEALQTKNKKSLSVQFHPEFSTEVSGNLEFSNEGFKIIQGIVSYARLNRQRISGNQCEKLF